MLYKIVYFHKDMSLYNMYVCIYQKYIIKGKMTFHKVFTKMFIKYYFSLGKM